MVMHARSGGKLEIMGLMLGKIDGNCMIVMDSFALPVEGTETRVNAQAAAYEYMTTYIEAAKKVYATMNVLLLKAAWPTCVLISLPSSLLPSSLSVLSDRLKG